MRERKIDRGIERLIDRKRGGGVKREREKEKVELEYYYNQSLIFTNEHIYNSKQLLAG